MSISCPYSLPPLTMRQKKDTADQPLDLSFTRKEKVIRKFKNHIPIQQISKELNLNINRIYSIISKVPLIKIKASGRYTSDIKNRIREAQNSGKTSSEIAEIFKLKLQQVLYIKRYNRAFLIKQFVLFCKYNS